MKLIKYALIILDVSTQRYFDGVRFSYCVKVAVLYMKSQDDEGLKVVWLVKQELYEIWQTV